MARARNIKPKFFKNELLVELPFEFRLLFIGLWTEADREGRLEDRPVRIKMEIFPGDSVDVDAGLQALHDRRFIERYQVGEAKYIQILAWSKHQNPHVREPVSSIPIPNEHSASTVPAQCQHQSGPADSPFLIPDSPSQGKETPPAAPAASATRAKTPRRESPHELLPEPPAWIDPQAWLGFVAMRKRERHPLTKRAAELIFMELDRLRGDGHDPTKSLNQSTRNGWRDVFAPKPDGAPHAASQRNRESSSERVARNNREAEQRGRATGVVIEGEARRIA